MSERLGFEADLHGQRVLVTGHTGFTGSWVSLWLGSIGVDTMGFALEPHTTPSLFTSCGLDKEMRSTYDDIRNYPALVAVVDEWKPDLILHLAAQPLVRRSYLTPMETFDVNCQGTVNVLEAARNSKSVTGVLCVTTDKVYENKGWIWPYRENDRLGGRDPYSASKAAAEMAIESYRSSFSFSDNKGPAIATARGGNIIGGGDWSEDRLIPDFVRAVVNDSSIRLRYPEATRPWQHVLALVEGYLRILAGLCRDQQTFARAWNLGPRDNAVYSVRSVLDIIGEHWAKPNIEYADTPLPEAHTLGLDSSLANRELGWVPAWDTHTAIEKTASWYKEYYECPGDARRITSAQIDEWRGYNQ